MSVLRVLADPDTVLAFALGGVSGRAVAGGAASAADLDAVVHELRAEAGDGREPGLLLLTHAVREAVRAEVDRLVLDAAGPLVLEIPGVGERAEATPVEDLVRRVLGVRL